MSSAERNVYRSESKVGKESSPHCVTVYRYDDFPLATAETLCKELRKTFPEVKLSDTVLELPAKYYLKERNRYSASGLLNDLKSRSNCDAVIGLTNRIIYHANEISSTYGIMGLSRIGTHSCVVSSRIPASGKTHSIDNFVKLALHELGHAYGLPHCPDQHCYMVDAEHKMKFPHTTGLCTSCHSKLKAAGWKLK
ncbi:MAG: hypothetical protein K2H47_05210 [Muribaculaceae bacterium]|nr:hypothetical protein [Muribaculaceae bacterium]